MNTDSETNNVVDIKKSTTISLTVSTNYVRSWGLWEALREFIQNGLDAHDEGHQLTITRGGGQKKTITIRNEGCILARETLLLGGGDKQDTGARGRFGEGYKLGLLALARMKASGESSIEVQIRTGSEIWTPVLERDDTFDAKLLRIRIRPTASYMGAVEVQIHYVSDGDWDIIQSQLLNIPGLPKTQGRLCVKAGRNQILLGEDDKGRLFSRGLYIGRLPGEYCYGYDLASLEVDRDRRIADPWSLQKALREVFNEVVREKSLSMEELYSLLQSESAEAKTVAEAYAYGMSDRLTQALYAHFLEVHGGNAVPVANAAEAILAEHHGRKGRVVTGNLKVLLEKETGTFETFVRTNENKPARMYQLDELDASERKALDWCMQLVRLALPALEGAALNVNIVDFFGTHTAGSFDTKTHEVRLARRTLKDPPEALATMVHEVAHIMGGDGSLSHERTIEAMFASMLHQLSY